MKKLFELLERPVAARIAVVGDVILDRYLWGDVDRISPEAPIPLIRVDAEEERLGGAGSVAAMLAALDVQVSLFSIIGADGAGDRTRKLLGELGIDAELLTDSTRITTTKQRVLGRAQHRHPQQMIRVDREQTDAAAEPQQQALLEQVAQRLEDFDLVIISDYDKGLCCGDFVPQLVARTRMEGVRVIADPIRSGDYRRYAGCHVITPNRMEAAAATGIEIDSPERGIQAAQALVRLGVDAALVTLDRDGIAWCDEAGATGLVSAQARQVYDITGAGDMVISALGYALAGRSALRDAVELANLAGGLEVERLGVVPLTRDELLSELSPTGRSAKRKILSLAECVPRLEAARQRGQRIAMTNGCFDLLHPGHVATIEAARQYGDLLVVGLNSDASVRALKGNERPIVDERGRAEMLAALEAVDFVVLFDDASVASLVEQLRPDVLVKAAEYDESEVVGGEAVKRYGGQVAIVPMRSSYSTSTLIERVRDESGSTIPQSTEGPK